MKPPSPRLAAALLAAGAFAVYAYGACRTIYVGDSGELVAAAATLGIPHPSGYPLFVLLGKLFTLLVPIGSIAFRMSLFSAVFGAAASGLTVLLASRSGLPLVPSVFSGALLAFSPSFWGEANVQRVYTLNAFFVVLVAYLAVSWDRERRDALLPAAALAAGLGASNHTFMAIMAMAVGLFAFVREPALMKRPRVLVACAGAFAAGLLPYLYLPLRSRVDPILDWGDPSTLDRFLAVVTRRDFWHRRFYEGPADLVPITLDYVRGLAHELAWVGLLLALVGVAVAWKRRWPALLALLVMLGNLLAMAFHGSRSDIFIWHRYDIPSFAMAAWLAGLGLAVVHERSRRAAAVLAVLVPAFLLVRGWGPNDRSRYVIGDAYSKELLKNVTPGAHLAASDDNILFVLIYLHHVERERPDVDLVLQGVGGSLPPLSFKPEVDPLFFADHPNISFPGLETVAEGLVFRLARAGQKLEPPRLPPPELPGESDPRVPKDYLTRNLLGQYHYMRGLTLARGDFGPAFEEFRKAQATAKDNDVLFYNLGLIFTGDGLFEEGLASFERAHEINPRLSRSPSGRRPLDERGPDRMAEARSEGARRKALEEELAAGDELRGVPRDSAEWHSRLARLFHARGEKRFAKGHFLRSEIARHGGGGAAPGAASGAAPAPATPPGS